MAALLSKTTVIAIEQESVYGEGPARDFTKTDTLVSATDSVVLDSHTGTNPTGVVSEATVKVYLDVGTASGSVDSTDTLLTYGTDYTIVTTSTETTVTFLSGGAQAGTEDVVIIYGIFEDADSILFDVGGYFDSNIAEITPNTANGQYITCPSLAGQETSSASITFDLKMLTTQPGSSVGMLQNHDMVKNALGYYAAISADVNKTTGTITENTGAGAYDLYRFAVVGESITSLAARQYLGSEAGACEDFFGVMAEGITMNMNTADLVKFDIPLQGINFTTVSETYGDPHVLSGQSCGGGSFVGKRAIFTIDDVSYDVTNLAFNPSNTLRDSNSVTSAGIYRKTITEKMLEGSFDFEIADTALVSTFKNNTAAEIYFELTNTDGDEIIVYFPNIRITQIGRTDDAGVIVQNTTFKAFMDANNNAFYMATKAA